MALEEKEQGVAKIHKRSISSWIFLASRRALKLGRGKGYCGIWATAFSSVSGGISILWVRLADGWGDGMERAVVRKGEEERGRRGREMKGKF